jgi:hypothetical protein
MRDLKRGAAQRWPAKHPHKPSSQALGARTLNRQHWRAPESLQRQKYRREEAGTFTGVMPPPTPARPRRYAPTPTHRTYAPGGNRVPS